MKKNKLSFESIKEYFENYFQQIDIIEINSKETVCAILHYMNELDGISTNILIEFLNRDHPNIKLTPGVFYKSLEMLKTNNYIEFEKKVRKPGPGKPQNYYKMVIADDPVIKENIQTLIGYWQKKYPTQDENSLDKNQVTNHANLNKQSNLFCL